MNGLCSPLELEVNRWNGGGIGVESEMNVAVLWWWITTHKTIASVGDAHKWGPHHLSTFCG